MFKRWFYALMGDSPDARWSARRTYAFAIIVSLLGWGAIFAALWFL